nr:PH domain-containing protein [Frateuria aurantia]
MLVPGESVRASTVQRRIFAITHRRALLAATTGRIIGMTRGLFGGFTPTDIRWQDVKDANIRVGIFSSSVIIRHLTQPDLASGGVVVTYRIDGLRKAEAQEVYRMAQAQEQSWREKRRHRELEEMRAKSGGFQGGFGSSQPATDPDPAARLKNAKEMLDQGLISDSEYETIKARVIGEL